jgi:hypothetical protein
VTERPASPSSTDATGRPSARGAEEQGDEAAGGDRYRLKILGLLRSGRVREDGRESIGGRDAIRLAADDGSVTLLVERSRARTSGPRA